MKKRLTVIIGLLTLFISLLLQQAAAGQFAIWVDNFDHYDTGASLHGVGGWKGFFNDPASTAFTSNFVARSAPNSLEIIGSTDLIHEYSVHSGQIYFRFYQYIPVTMTGISYFIMLNQYNDSGSALNWSVQVQHAGQSGLIIDDGTGASMPIIRDQWVEVCIEIDLDTDTQAYYYNGQELYSGTWSQHISGGGIPSFGAVSLFANGASPVFYDDMRLGEGDCSTPSSDLFLPLINH